MEYGLGIPTRGPLGPLADRESIAAIAARAEALGFSWLAVTRGQVLLNFQRADLERSLESMEHFAGEVMSKT